MPHCAAYGCSNSTAKDPDLYFMRFPDDRELCRQWLHNTGRGGAWKPTKHSRLCSEHFEESCFERDLYAELMESDARCLRRRAKRLKADAVPTLFGHTAGSVSKAKAPAGAIYDLMYIRERRHIMYEFTNIEIQR